MLTGKINARSFRVRTGSKSLKIAIATYHMLSLKVIELASWARENKNKTTKQQIQINNMDLF